MEGVAFIIFALEVPIGSCGYSSICCLRTVEITSQVISLLVLSVAHRYMELKDLLGVLHLTCRLLLTYLFTVALYCCLSYYARSMLCCSCVHLTVLPQNNLLAALSFNIHHPCLHQNSISNQNTVNTARTKHLMEVAIKEHYHRTHYR